MHPAVAESLTLLALAIREQGRLAEAAVPFGEALVITRTLSGRDNPEVVVSHFRLVGVDSCGLKVLFLFSILAP